jgi:glycerol-1-phosphate dehydrogenase [NAD(P)+]
LSLRLPDVVIADDAIERLAGYLRDLGVGDALVVMDANTREAAGVRVTEVVRAAGVDARELVFEQGGGLLAGLDEVSTVCSDLQDDTKLIAVGSGVITDIVRYAAHLSDLDFVSVPTAASMDGYASSVAALQLGGVKVTYPARAPTAIFADPRVAAAAPPELTSSGIGDLLAKATARVDWLAAHVLYGESFNEEVAERVLEPLGFAASNVERVVAGDPDAIRALLVGLVQSGIAMAILGNSRPASGCEHHASHFWDLLAARGLRPHTPHGLQVGYATRFAMRLQRFAFAGGVPVLRIPLAVEDPFGPAAGTWLGEPTAELVAAVEEKQRFVAAVPASWPRDDPAWSEVRAQLKPALDQFPTIERALSVAGIPAEPGYLGIDADTLKATFHFATRLRARYTTVDFLEGQRLLDEAVEGMLG